MKQQLTKLLCSVLLIALAIPVFAQSTGGSSTHTISGKVIDSEGIPVVGAVVMVSPQEATTTGSEGTYSLAVKNPNATLQFSCMGYRSRSENAAGRSTIDVTLETDNQLLDDVVVIGYGVQKKVNLTGAVAAIDFAKTGESRSIVSTSASLAGLAAGMNVSQTSGQPGDNAAKIRIRGEGSFTSSSNGPLVLVDGIEWNMDNVNPNDIASISVLKDAASASIYGTRAANGVILITTKNGSTGKAQISYSYKGIVQMPYNDLHFVSNYARHMSLINESCDNVGTSTIFSGSNIELWEEKSADPYGLSDNGVPNFARYPNTDWFDWIFEDGYSQEHNVSISGGSKTTRYLISLGYLDNQGVMGRFGINSSTQKSNFRANMEGDVTKWFTVGVRLFGQRQDYGLANISNAFNALYQTTPGVYPGSVNAWGKPALAAEESSNANNIFGMMYGSGGYQNETRVNGSVYVKIQPYKDVSVEATVNYSPTFGERHSYSRQNGYWDYTTDTRYSGSELASSSVWNTTTRNYNISSEIIAHYNKTIGDHDFGVLVGYSAMEYKNWGWGANRKGATDWTLNDLGTYEMMESISSTPKTGWGLRSYFGRVNYSYKDRYLFEANLRADGSSRFGNNNRYGYFPSFSAGWRISEEAFMEGTKSWLSSLKLRASWGKAGNNQGIGNYVWQAVYATQNVIVDGDPSKGLYISSLSNANLKWETTATTDIGLDVGLFGNKLTAEIDYYRKNTTDILYTPTIYMTMGEVAGVPSNLGSVENKGIELTLNWKSHIGKDFSYYAGVNFSYNRNKVTKFKGKLVKQWADGIYSNNLSDVSTSYGQGKLCEGHALGEHYLRRLYKGSGKGYYGGAVDIKAGPKDGMIRTQQDFEWVEAMLESGYSFNGITALSKDQLWYGDLIYSDRDGDGNYGDDDDMDFNGRTSMPTYNLGINLGFAWKGIDFNMTWSGAFDYSIIWNASYYNGTQTTNGYGISERIANDHYFFDVNNPTDTRTNLTASYPRLTFGTAVSNRLASEFYEYNGNYLKLRNVQVGYTLPARITKKFFVQQLRVFVSGENLLTLTDYPGLDPESGATIGYPLMRSVTFGAQITF